MRKGLRLVVTVLASLYGLACAGALIVAAVGLLGRPPEPLALVYAIFLTLPWSLLIGTPPGLTNAIGNLLMLVAYMGLNMALLLAVRRLLRQHGSQAQRS